MVPNSCAAWTRFAVQQVRLRSIHSKQAAVIVFANKSRHRVRALWVDFKGNEVSSSTAVAHA